jgi:ABC-type uncharacterized transport system permease subunit
MLVLVKICEALLPLAYSGAVVAYGLTFFRKEEGFARWTRPALLAALLVHSLLIYAETIYHGHCLVYNPFEVMTLVAFTITLTYLVVEVASGERGTGFFFLSLALLLQTLSAMFAPSVESASANPVLLNDIVGVHISAALFGYTAFAISAVYGGLYLMLYHQLKSSRFGTFYERLPSLQLLEKMSEKASIIGVIFLVVAIVVAVVWLPRILPGFTYHDPKLISTFVILGIYLCALAAKYLARLEGRKVMILSLAGFIGTILSMTVINFIASGFHRFI